MRRLLLVLLFSAAAYAQTPAAQLVNNVLKNPGYFNQNCNIPPPLPDKQLPLYGYRRSWSDSKISAENFTKLRAERSEVVKALAVQLDAINVANFVGDSDYEARARDETLLMMVLDLNAVETLAALLRLEKSLDKVAYYRSGKSAPPKDYRLPPHAQVLSVITAILKNENAAGVDKLGPKASYDKATRDRIVALADQFERNVDPSRWKRGKAMSARPEAR